MPTRMLLLLLQLASFSAVLLLAAGQSLNCQDGIAWEKVRGMRPESYKSGQALYTGMDSQGIVVACFHKCRSLNCSAFIVDVERSVCSEVTPEGDEFVPEANVTFYHKICLNAPKSCLESRLWQVERSLGSVLLDSRAVFVGQMVSRKDCYEMCMKEKSCKAAQFRTSKDLRIGDTFGSCSLLTIERASKAQSYRASLYRDEYLENQCHDISQRDFCSYAEYRNASLAYSDVKLEGLNAAQCEERCDESRDGFLCRAYGMEYSTGSTCLLHSDDTIGAGVSSLLSGGGGGGKAAFYREREPCIDMRVSCSNKSLTVELRTNEPFVGRIYASGHSEACGAQGHGGNVTRLVLSLPDTRDLDRASMSCGLTPVYSLDQDNRTRAAIWSTVVVQFNPIIQRLGDQAVRVGCTLAESNQVPGPRNITVQSSYTFIDNNAGLPPVVSTVMNTSSEVPVVSMNILDETLNQANVTHIGQKLILQIKMMPSNGPFDMQAGHLVASSKSGEQSLLLLDEAGCPVSSVFPALSKDPADNRSLIAEFSAFKFPSSAHVRFNVIVRFCLQSCEPVKCSNNRLSYGRKKRDTNDTDLLTVANVTQLYAGPAANGTTTTTTTTTTTEELPLQTSIIVQDPRDQHIHPNPLRAKDDTLLLLGSDYMDSQFCMNASLALFLLVFLLIIQILLIGSCVLAVRTYRRLAIRAEEDRADILARHLYGLHAGNFEISRRVRWADNNDSTLS